MKKIIIFFSMILVLGTLILVKYFGPWEPLSKDGPTIDVLLVSEQKTVKMSMESYLVGVLAAEMPARFEEEALKAQAIAARTYALRKIKSYQSSGNKEHPKAEICTNPSHCQGWLSEKEMKKKWGWLKSWEYEKKLKQAVRETAGEAAIYQNNLIDPVYHSTCGGRTENAEEIWTFAIPYLQSVKCEFDRESPKFQSNILVSFSEFNKKLSLNIKQSNFSAKTIKVMEKTSTGRVKTAQVASKVFSATEFRKYFNLNSTNFSWRITKDGIVFKTIGYGHGVGMCQYGANGLAKKGYSGEKILNYYYPGIVIQKMY